MSKRFRIVFACACAVLSVLLCALYADHVQGEAERVRSEAIARYGGEVVTLVVATDALEPGDVITQNNVEQRDWLADLAPDDAVMALEDVLGLEVSEPASRGAVLTDVNFRDDEAMAEVPQGHVALTLPVSDKLGLSRNVAQGSSLEAYQVGSEGTHLIATDMQVLSRPQTATFGSSQVTIAVLPDDVAPVLAASASGDLRLVVPADDVRDSYSLPTAPEELTAPEESAASEEDAGGATTAEDGANATGEASERGAGEAA
jgi:pilus assembly protein CpaB